jgi:hypothetical protein
MNFRAFLLTLILMVCIYSTAASQKNNANKFKNDLKDIDAILSFCKGKSKKNFCSEDNLRYMFQVIKDQIKETKEIEKVKMEEMRTQMKHKKLTNFFALNPKYKFMFELPTPRFF